MFTNEVLKTLYVAMLKQYESTNQQILSFTTLLSRCQGSFEALSDEVQIRLLALNVTAQKESELLSKLFKLWKGGNAYEKTKNEP